MCLKKVRADQEQLLGLKGMTSLAVVVLKHLADSPLTNLFHLCAPLYFQFRPGAEAEVIKYHKKSYSCDISGATGCSTNRKSHEKDCSFTISRPTLQIQVACLNKTSPSISGPVLRTSKVQKPQDGLWSPQSFTVSSKWSGPAFPSSYVM